MYSYSFGAACDVEANNIEHWNAGVLQHYLNRSPKCTHFQCPAGTNSFPTLQGNSVIASSQLQITHNNMNKQQNIKKSVATPAKTQVSKVVEKDAKAIEKKIEQVKARNPEMELHPGSVSSRSGERHGHLRRTAIRQMEDGTVVHTYAGTERLAATDLDGSLAPGDVIDQFQLAPTAFGAVLPQFATPFSKFNFKKAKLRWVGEAALIDQNTAGSIYVGLNFNPDAELPFGETGATTMATWAPNEMVCPLRELQRKSFDARLHEGSQIPLFVGLNGDDKFESQAKIVVAAGTTLNPEGNTIAIGELFIDYIVDLYQMNAGQSDIKKGSVFGFQSPCVNSSNGFLDFNATGAKWVGDGDVITCPPISTAVSFVTDSNGTYLVQVEALTNNGTATVTRAILQYYTVANQPPPVVIDTSFFHTTDSSGVLGANKDLVMRNTATTSYYNASASLVAGVLDAPVAIKSWCFTAVAGTPFALAAPVFTLGTSSAWISIVKLDNAYHKNGDLPLRTVVDTTANFMVQRTVSRTLSRLQSAHSISSDQKLKLIEFIVKNRSSLDPSMLNIMISKCELPIELSPSTTMILPALAAVASWAIVTFGPIVADKAVKWICRKLDGK